MSMIITSVTHVLQQTEKGYRVIEKWGDVPHQQVDLFGRDLAQESAENYIELLTLAMEAGCFVIEGLLAAREPEGSWRVFDGRSDKIHGRFETVGYALLMMISPLHRMAHQLPPVPERWNPLFIYVQEAVIWV